MGHGSTLFKVPALRKLNQEDQKFKGSLGNIVNSRQAWAIKNTTVSQSPNHKSNKKKTLDFTYFFKTLIRNKKDNRHLIVNITAYNLLYL